LNIEKYKITTALVVPPILVVLKNHPCKYLHALVVGIKFVDAELKVLRNLTSRVSKSCCLVRLLSESTW
jgi:hypothetical protein